MRNKRICVLLLQRFSSACARPILDVSIGDAVDTSHVPCEICKQLPLDTSQLRITYRGALRVCQLWDMPDRFEIHTSLFRSCRSVQQNDTHGGRHEKQLLYVSGEVIRGLFCAKLVFLSLRVLRSRTFPCSIPHA